MKSIFFFNDTATTEIYTLSLHDALPISIERSGHRSLVLADTSEPPEIRDHLGPELHPRSEEHTSELQSRQYLVCRLLLEKKKDSRTKFFFYNSNITLTSASRPLGEAILV